MVVHTNSDVEGHPAVGDASGNNPQDSESSIPLFAKDSQRNAHHGPSSPVDTNQKGALDQIQPSETLTESISFHRQQDQSRPTITLRNPQYWSRSEKSELFDSSAQRKAKPSGHSSPNLESDGSISCPHSASPSLSPSQMHCHSHVDPCSRETGQVHERPHIHRPVFKKRSSPSLENSHASWQKSARGNRKAATTDNKISISLLLNESNDRESQASASSSQIVMSDTESPSNEWKEPLSDSTAGLSKSDSTSKTLNQTKSSDQGNAADKADSTSNTITTSNADAARNTSTEKFSASQAFPYRTQSDSHVSTNEYKEPDSLVSSFSIEKHEDGGSPKAPAKLIGADTVGTTPQSADSIQKDDLKRKSGEHSTPGKDSPRLKRKQQRIISSVQKAGFAEKQESGNLDEGSDTPDTQAVGVKPETPEPQSCISNDSRADIAGLDRTDDSQNSVQSLYSMEEKRRNKASIDEGFSGNKTRRTRKITIKDEDSSDDNNSSNISERGDQEKIHTNETSSQIALSPSIDEKPSDAKDMIESKSEELMEAPLTPETSNNDQHLLVRKFNSLPRIRKRSSAKLNGDEKDVSSASEATVIYTQKEQSAPSHDSNGKKDVNYEPLQEPEKKRYRRPTARSSSIQRSVDEKHQAALQKIVTETDNNRSVNRPVDYYNQKQEISMLDRSRLAEARVRNFHNWIKSVLICNFTKEGYNVLDMGFGKGGDLLKWSKSRIASLTGVDIAGSSLAAAEMRYKKRELYKQFPARFLQGDCFTQPISSIIGSNTQFDIVSMQFCLHYSFEEEQKAKQIIRNVSSSLRPEGDFIGTIPDSDVIERRLKRLEPGKLKLGNSMYSLKFDYKPTEYWRPPYGHRYIFDMANAVENVPEYVVPFETLRALAHEVGLELVWRKSFREILEEYKNVEEFRLLLDKMGIHDDFGNFEVSTEEWGLSSLYTAFVFRKMR